MTKTLFSPTGQSHSLAAADETKLRNELTKLRTIHAFEEKKREARIRRIEEVKKALGEVEAPIFEE